MNAELIFIGSGGHARVLLDLVTRRGYKVFGYVDASKNGTFESLSHARYLGNDSVLRDTTYKKYALVNAVGSIKSDSKRKNLYLELKSQGYTFATLIDPLSNVSSTAKISEGAQIMLGSNVQTGAHIHPNVILNTGCTVDHDCIIEAHTHIAPGAVLSGSVHVGEESHIGTGAVVIQGIKIGKAVTVGAGAVVIKNIQDHATVVGIPAK